MWFSSSQEIVRLSDVDVRALQDNHSLLHTSPTHISNMESQERAEHVASVKTSSPTEYLSYEDAVSRLTTIFGQDYVVPCQHELRIDRNGKTFLSNGVKIVIGQVGAVMELHDRSKFRTDGPKITIVFYAGGNTYGDDSLSVGRVSDWHDIQRRICFPNM